MSRRSPITDSDLHAHLRRRFHDGTAESHLAGSDLVAAVRSKTEHNQAPSAIRHGQALAGLAAVIAVLAVLVLAVPRVTPGSGTAQPMTDAPPSTVTPTGTGRLDSPPAPVARDVDCPIDHESPEADLVPITRLSDHTGLVAACAARAGSPEYMSLAWSDLIVRNSEPDQLQVIWATTQCDRHADVSLAQRNDGSIGIEVLLTDNYAECGSRAAQYLVLDLSEPLSVTQVAASLTRTSQVPDPDPPPSPFPAFVECGSDVMFIDDATGLIERCLSWDPALGESNVTPGRDSSSARIAWTYSSCRGAPFARFEHDGQRYWAELSFMVDLPSVLPPCEPVIRTVGVEIKFSQPIDIGLISAPSYGDPPRPRPTIDVAPLRRQADEALARWADAVSQSGGQGIVFVDEITRQTGNWEDDVGSNNKSALYAGLIEAAVPLGPEALPPGQIRWIDGTTRSVALLSPTEALQELTAHATSTCDQCEPILVTEARLASADFETTRGTANVPVWKYTLAGSNVKVIQVAVADAISLVPPPWDPYDPPRGASIGSARGAPDSRELLVTTESEPPRNAETCSGYTAEAIESELALVVIITAFQADSSQSPSDVPCAVVTLASPLGSRTVLEVTQGRPVVVFPR